MDPHAAFRIRAAFFLHALGSGGIYARIPDIQQAMGMDAGTLGLVFLGFTLGAIAVFLFASPVIEGFGTKPVMLISLPVLAVATALLAMMPNAAAMFALFVAYGAIYGLPNVALNIEADRVEAALGRRIMNSCHGIWSFGYLLATLLGTLAAGVGTTPALHLGLVAIPVAIAAVLVIAPMQPAPARPHSGAGQRRFALPTLPVLLLVCFMLGPALVEGGLRNWSVIYMRDSFAAPPWVDTLTLPLFLVTQAFGRMGGDRLVTRFGVVPSTRTLMVVTLLSLLAVVLAPNVYVALVGFLMMGVGLCVYYPLATSAAARLGDRPSSQNVSALTLALQGILLGAPAAQGFIADHWGTRITFAVMLPGIAIAVWLARYLQPKEARLAAA